MQPLRPDDPREVGPYRLEGRLGAGGMGEVFLGVSPGGRRVAVKLIRAEFAADARFRSRFAREIEAARKVGGFHTAPVVDADPEAGSPWMVTAFVPGPSLRQVVVRQGPLPPHEVRRLGAGLAEGLAAIHGSGLVHRDLKPGNVIMAADGPRIIDFGIARAADATSLTSAGVVVGTFSFMSPEQVRAEETGPPGDVFSLGCLLTYAATGHGPFDAPTIPAIVHRITSAPPALDGLAGDLHEIVAACLAKDPAARPTIPHLLDRLTAPGPPPVPAPRPAPSPVTAAASGGVPRRGLLLGGAAAAA
ncbi:serine/threonine-protein kinase, partial [Spirillospora sp. NPDC049652]